MIHYIRVMNYNGEYAKRLYFYEKSFLSKNMECVITVYKMTKIIEIMILKINRLMVDTFAKV
jgi:hypothetical protein